MQFEIKHLHESLGITVFYVTHDQGEALTMSDRVAVFNDGKIQQAAARRPVRTPREQLCRAVHRREQQTAGHDRGVDRDKALVRLATGELIDATAVNAKEKGGKTLVSIRPERVEFKPEMMPPGAHTIEAEGRDHLHGRHSARGAARGRSDDFVMKMRNTLGQTKLSPGQKIKVLASAGCPRAGPLMPPPRNGGKNEKMCSTTGVCE